MTQKHLYSNVVTNYEEQRLVRRLYFHSVSGKYRSSTNIKLKITNQKQHTRLFVMDTGYFKQWLMLCSLYRAVPEDRNPDVLLDIISIIENRLPNHLKALARFCGDTLTGNGAETSVLIYLWCLTSWPVLLLIKKGFWYVVATPTGKRWCSKPTQR